MTRGKQIFIAKAVAALVIFMVFAVVVSQSVEATTRRFGGMGWVPLIIGVLSLVAGLLVAWGTVLTWLDRRNLRLYRVDPNAAFKDGQTLALSGEVKVQGEPLISPFSDKPCAAFSYQVTGQTRSPSSNHNVQQLCLLGFHMRPAVLDCGDRTFALHAIASAEDELRSTTMGGQWGERALARIRAVPESEPQTGEEDARGALSDAQVSTPTPVSADYFVAPTRTTANQITVMEDIVPVNARVTVLARYNTRTQGLDGQRWGGVKVFAGDLDDRLAILNKEWRQGSLVSASLLAVGLALMTLAQWFPA
ncbi:hypothetical protein [Gilvimarinus algae]|uniref:RING-type E3 ubiquitin transferase n=1 Tax=Gilvimarinus algae TaxID=3058037 RepID=A0ABT8TDC2_9GAMM|nr:hypothetical protein [Gilvimarinus sp. SDUM040014]MDO3381625.1 hypothetical protein [Gilvimarinus sp. SDUM040014]